MLEKLTSNGKHYSVSCASFLDSLLHFSSTNDISFNHTHHKQVIICTGQGHNTLPPTTTPHPTTATMVNWDDLEQKKLLFAMVTLLQANKPASWDNVAAMLGEGYKANAIR